jgi:hypothetical protein
LNSADARQLATYALAGADGLFIASEIAGDALDLIAMFDMHVRAVVDTARRLIEEAAQ